MVGVFQKAVEIKTASGKGVAYHTIPILTLITLVPLVNNVPLAVSYALLKPFG